MINMIKITINVDLHPTPPPPPGYRDRQNVDTIVSDVYCRGGGVQGFLQECGHLTKERGNYLMKLDCLICLPCPQPPPAQPITIVITSFSCLNSQYRGRGDCSLTGDLILSGQCQHVVGLVNTAKIFHPAAVKIFHIQPVRQKLSGGIIIHISNLCFVVDKQDSHPSSD